MESKNNLKCNVNLRKKNQGGAWNKHKKHENCNLQRNGIVTGAVSPNQRGSKGSCSLRLLRFYGYSVPLNIFQNLVCDMRQRLPCTGCRCRVHRELQFSNARMRSLGGYFKKKAEQWHRRPHIHRRPAVLSERRAFTLIKPANTQKSIFLFLLLH